MASALAPIEGAELGKVIVVTCMHSLMANAYGVLRSDKPFDANRLMPTDT